MNILRITLVAVAALGVTWAAEQVVQRASQGGVPVLTQVETGRSDAPGEAREQSDTGTSEPEALPELSSEEVAEELARIEAAVAAAEGEELKVFTPSKPLAADLAISLPSDI